MTDKHTLGITILSASRRTTVPRRVMEALNLRPAPDRIEKILWTLDGPEVIVEKGTPQSDFKKTKLGVNGRAAVPKHVREALKLKSTLQREERMIWIRKGDKIVVRKGEPRSSPTD